jgi:hypothetical protein
LSRNQGTVRDSEEKKIIFAPKKEEKRRETPEKQEFP